MLFATIDSTLTSPAAAAFGYEDYFRQQIDAKKQDHTYRVFKRVDRKGADFPLAREMTTGKDITVWCSNDYLGMSWHPNVQASVM